MKLTITMNDELLRKADEYAKQNFLTRSGLIAISLNQYLMQQDMIIAIKQLSRSMQEIARKSVVDDETIKYLKDIESVVNMLTQNNL